MFSCLGSGPVFDLTLAWKIPWTEEPGGLKSMGSLRVGHTPAFLSGKSHGQRSLVGYSPWGCLELLQGKSDLS